MAENVIELNGKRYDAISGAYLGTAQTQPIPAAARPAKKGRAIDGFIRPTPTNAHHTKPARPIHHKTSDPAKKAPTAKPGPDITHKKSAQHTLAHAHRKAAAARAHTPQRASTLMRRAVHKPAAVLKPAIKTQTPAEVAAKPLSAITVKRSALQVDDARVERAKHIVRHSGIRRFMPVRPDYTPTALANTPQRSTPGIPVIAVRPAPAPVAHHARTHSDIFEAAIARADSHKQPKHPAKRPAHRRLVNTLAVIGAFLVIGGFVTYLNIPNIQLHIASVQAGFKADIPHYKPTGYALQGGIKRTGNTVSMRFTSGENIFTITQQPSDWNSQTLAENTLALTGNKHQTIVTGGRTVYIYDGNNAVWVAGGVRYDLTTNAPLSTDDIAKLASSL